MPKPASLMIAIGLPGPHGGDEDNLDRENHKAGNGKGELATQVIHCIVNALDSGGPSAVRDLRTLADCFSAMADAFMDGDNDALGQAAHDAADGLHELLTT
jgi:hypothetical protein